MELLDLIKDFGITLTEEQETKLKQAVGKEYVLRSDYNVKNQKVKDLEKEKSELEKRDFASIESECDDYKGKYEGLQKEKDDNTKKEKFFSKLEGCRDKDYVLYKLGGVDKLELDDKQEIKDIDNLVKTAKESYPSYFGKAAPFVVSRSDGPNQNTADQKDQANAAFRSLFGKE